VLADENDPAEVRRYHQEAENDEQFKAIRRPGRPEEQASAIAFLASDDASYVTGQVIDCRGEP
jgi:NAD(P)-dependent dehydrogenase (short-subunit alcohol dehydrogenase family)